MKTNRNPKLIRSLAAAVGGLPCSPERCPQHHSSTVRAIWHLPSVRPAAHPTCVVNIGKATNYNTLPLGTSVSISNLLVAHLGSAFAGVNDLAWAVGGANRLGGDPNYPANALWVTKPRLDASTQSTPWLREGQFDQRLHSRSGGWRGRKGGNLRGNVASNANNTATAVVIPSNNLDYGLNVIIGNGDYGWIVPRQRTECDRV
ncbi:MAG: hypothetical protein V9H26_20705 [Verrucomicrobiota bacterium]